MSSVVVFAFEHHFYHDTLSGDPCTQGNGKSGQFFRIPGHITNGWRDYREHAIGDSRRPLWWTNRAVSQPGAFHSSVHLGIADPFGMGFHPYIFHFRRRLFRQPGGNIDPEPGDLSARASVNLSGDSGSHQCAHANRCLVDKRYHLESNRKLSAVGAFIGGRALFFDHVPFVDPGAAQ